MFTSGNIWALFFNKYGGRWGEECHPGLQAGQPRQSVRIQSVLNKQGVHNLHTDRAPGDRAQSPRTGALSIETEQSYWSAVGTSRQVTSVKRSSVVQCLWMYFRKRRMQLQRWYITHTYRYYILFCQITKTEEFFFYSWW